MRGNILYEGYGLGAERRLAPLCSTEVVNKNWPPR